MEENFQHRQIGVLNTLMILLAGVFAVFAFYNAIDSAEGSEATMLIVVGFLVIIILIFFLAAFYAFTIQVQDGNLTFWFGVGVVRKSILFEEITSVTIVENPWYYLWGVKSMPGGWYYGISPGGRAIDLTLKSNEKFRLGTDRPEEIEQQLKDAMERSQNHPRT